MIVGENSVLIIAAILFLSVNYCNLIASLSHLEALFLDITSYKKEG